MEQKERAEKRISSILGLIANVSKDLPSATPPEDLNFIVVFKNILNKWDD